MGANMRKAIEVYWRGRRIGSADGVSTIDGEKDSIELDANLSIQEVAALNIAFDPVFADLRGITNGETE